jgi:hypothetical protein
MSTEIFYKEGSYDKAALKYYEESLEVNHLRKKYRKAFPQLDIHNSYNKAVVKGQFLKESSLKTKLKTLFYRIKTVNWGIERTQLLYVSPALLLLVTTYYIHINRYYSLLNSSMYEFLSLQLLDFETIFGLLIMNGFVFGGVLSFLIYYLVKVVRDFSTNSNPVTTILPKTLLVIIFTLFTLFMSLIMNLIIGDQAFFGFKDDGYIIGYEEIKYEEVTNISIESTECSNNCNDLKLIYLKKYPEDEDVRVVQVMDRDRYDFPNDNALTENQTCNVIEYIQKNAEERNVKVNLGEKILSKCRDLNSTENVESE